MKNLIISHYEGQELSFDEFGWFNATQASLKFNKAVHEWVRLPDTKKYIDALTRKYGKIPYLKTKRGYKGSTWLHPKLAVRFAQWLDADFAVWCDEQIDLLLRGLHPIFDRYHLRHQTVSTYKAISDVLRISRKRLGKETNKFHYMNEAKLINWAITGQFCGLDRDRLSYNELKLLAEVEAENLVLIGLMFTYEERKKALKEYADNFKNEKNLELKISDLSQ